MVLELAVKLLAVTVVIVITLVMLSRYAGRGGRASGGAVRVAARHGVSRNALVAVVEVDGRRFLVGVGEHNVNLLTELDPAEDVAEELDAPTPRTAAPGWSRLSELTAAAWKHRNSRPTPQRMGRELQRPGIGPLNRLRAMTVRTPQERPIHVNEPQ